MLSKLSLIFINFRDFRFQWIITCCFVAAVALFFSDVYADTLAPFFDTILPIVTHKIDTEEGKKEIQLETQIQDLSKRLEFPLGIFLFSTINFLF